MLSLSLPTFSEESPCTVVVGQREYDFNALAAQDHWQVEDVAHVERKIYLSLCHPLRNAPAGCAGNAGVCITQVMASGDINVTAPNAGRVSPVGPTIPEGQVMVEYVMESEVPCPVAEGETYRTSINFICTHSPEDETGPVLMSNPKCDFLFAWMTQAACPRRLDVVETTPCSIDFPSSDHKLHLQTLRAETYYPLSSAKPPGTYEVNICGPVVNGSCSGEDVAVCYTPKDGSPQILATTRDLKVRWEDSTLALAYHPANENKGVEVRFTCDRNAANTRVYYITQNATSVILGSRTSAVCPPTPTPLCVLDDHAGNVYDLRPLHRTSDNWEVLQSSSDGQEVLYYLNICGPVNPAMPYTCPSGLLGACRAGLGTEASYNLGLLTSDPAINIEDGSITILYSGGDPCKGGQDSHSTRINLICSHTEYGPVLVKETNTCEFVFDWLTPVACPRHSTTGNNCRVEDPKYGNVFDLNPLRNIYRDYNVTNEGDIFSVNLCGPLISPCAGENGTSGVCQVNKDQQFSAGHYTTQVRFNDGTLMMSYTNGTGGCDGNSTRSSEIIFLCDHEVSGRDGPLFFSQHGCTSSFFWKTKQACPPFHKVDCTLYTAEGMVYNLHELSSSDTNLEYYTTDGKKFVFNVCRSIVHQKGSRCPYRAGACIVDRTHHNSSINIGEVQSGPYLENGKLMIKYSGGDQCEGGTQLYQTLIEFKCDEDETFSFPRLVAEENCTYYFELKSAAACPIPVQNTSLLQVGSDCTVSSPNGYNFNLNPLKQENGYTIKDHKNLSMTLNVCAALKNSACPEDNIGACTSTGSAGQANANLYYLPEHLSLHYTNGEKCRENLNRSTIITFVCGAENTTEGPVLVFDDIVQCVYFITWYTELACEKRIPCVVNTWTHQIDLSTLIKSVGNYEAVNPKNPSEKFYLNVCRPLNHIIGLNCRPGSAICKSSSGENPLSLGHPSVTPVHDGSGGARIMYTHGARCPTVHDYNLSSMIHFICDPGAGMGNPVFKEMTHDCQYQFEWHTSVVCDTPSKIEDSGPQCQIRFDDAKTNIDLRPLYRHEGYQVNFGNKTFTVNVCGSACNTSGSCTSDGDSYGLSNKSVLQWEYGQLSLKYYGGSICNGSVPGKKSSSIFFECDMSKGYGFPVADELMESLHCEAVFTWKTNVTCIEGIYATEYTPPVNVSSVNNTAGQSSYSSDGVKDKTSAQTSVSAVVSSILVVSGTVFVVALFLIKTRRGNHILASARRLFGVRGYVRSDQPHVENSTLLGTSSSIRIFKVDDSDDDLLRV